MKIMQINCVYKVGSTGKILFDLEQYFVSEGHEVINVYGLGTKDNNKNNYKVLNKFLQFFNIVYTYSSGYMYKGSYISTLRIKRLIKKYKPDIVVLHSINGHMVNIYSIVSWLKKRKMPLIVVNHGEFFYTGSYTHVPEGSNQWLTGEKEKYPNAKKLTNSWFFDKTYSAIKKMKKAFDGNDNMVVVSVSPWVTERSSRSFVFKDKKHTTILNGIETKTFYPRETKELIEKLKLKDEKIVLHVTSGFDNRIKGSSYMLELAKTMLNDNYKFIFVGIKEKVELPPNCINVGVIYNQDELAEYYSLADVTVITSFRETFSMVVAESLSCGTPIVGFKAGGPESIALKEYSEFVEFGDVEALKTGVIKKAQSKDVTNISKLAHQKYDKGLMAKKYLETFKEVLTKNKQI